MIVIMEQKKRIMQSMEMDVNNKNCLNSYICSRSTTTTTTVAVVVSVEDNNQHDTLYQPNMYDYYCYITQKSAQQ